MLMLTMMMMMMMMMMMINTEENTMVLISSYHYNCSLQARMYAAIGGWKYVFDGPTPSNITFQPTNVSPRYQYINVIFDVIPPRHCSQLDNCLNDTIPPVTFEYDITSVSSIWIEMYFVFKIIKTTISIKTYKNLFIVSALTKYFL